jgi:quercetin dioxygenase-like cupin family protein
VQQGNVEVIRIGEAVLAYIIRVRGRPQTTTFYTPDEASLQVGHVVYAAGQEIQRHIHLPVERHLRGTAEVLVVQHGRCELDVFSADRQLVATRTLEQGDIAVSLAGGHGFRLLEDTVLLEIKQGPYPGLAAVKERF